MLHVNDSRLRYSSIDLAYFFQDLRSEALKAISWPSRCGAIVIPASGDTQTVNCAGTRAEVTDRREAEVEGGMGMIFFFTWWHDSVVEGWVVGTDGPHEAKQAAAKHGCQERIKCSIEEENKA